MAKEPKAKEHSKKSKAKEYTKTCLEDSTKQIKTKADKISIDKNKEKTEKNIFLYFYILIFFIPLQAMKSATASARFFTLHSSLFTFH